MRFAVMVLGFDVDDFIQLMIENCTKHVDKVFFSYSKTPWNYIKEARENFHNQTSPDIFRNSKFEAKIEVIEGCWDTEEEQRNACLSVARQQGYDYLIIQDADEFYTFVDFERNLNKIKEFPEFDYYTTPWCSFWKSTGYLIEDSAGDSILGFPEFAVNCNRSVEFVRARRLQGENSLRLSGLCYHLSMVRSDQCLWRKVNTWGHAHQFEREKWFQRKWLKWHPGMRFLHPVEPFAWDRAVPFRGELPEVLKNFENPFTCPFRPSVFDRLEEAVSDAGLRLSSLKGRLREFPRGRNP